MENNEYILLENICTHYNIDISLMDTLHGMGLINLTFVDERKYLHHEDLMATEKMIRLHDELGINPEGIDVIVNLLQQLDEVRRELEITKKKLDVFVSGIDF